MSVNFNHFSVPVNQDGAHASFGLQQGKYHYLKKFTETLFITPITTTTILALRAIKLLTYTPLKSACLMISGYHNESSSYLETQYLKTVKVARDLLFLPSTVKRAYLDLFNTTAALQDDLPSVHTSNYLKVSYTKQFMQYSSHLHGVRSVDVIKPIGITSFEAVSDASLKTVMASHFLPPGMIAINFGVPNVATFATVDDPNNGVQTIKVDAKSLKRAPMQFHPTNGKVQSGVFIVPKNLPKEAIDRFIETAQQMQGRSDITCVNTNCRILKNAGFSIANVEMDDIVFPGTFFEHLLYRDLYYTDKEGITHKVHFDLLNTTEQSLEEFFETVDTAVVGTRLRHSRRNSDTEENQRERGEAAKAIINEEKKRLSEMERELIIDGEQPRREMTVSVPSFLGNMVAKLWGRHTIYEVNLSDKQELIRSAFDELSPLSAFPEQNPSLATRLKRDLFFSQLSINFLRRHMMGRADTINLYAQDLFKHLQSTKGARLNYVLLDDKVVMAKVYANEGTNDHHTKAADWALSKHALLASRQNVRCSGEIWYDESTKSFKMNKDSGTYKPENQHLTIAVNLANHIFESKRFGLHFESAN